MKKGVLKTIFLCLMIAVILFFGMEIFKEFMANHTYYNDMFWTWSNWWIVISALLSCAFPVGYILFKNKKFSILWFLLTIFIWAFVFWVLNLSIRHSTQFLSWWWITFICFLNLIPYLNISVLNSIIEINI